MLKYMSRFTFAALAVLCISSVAGAQQVPGRDLLEFPLGLLAEAPALSSRMTAELWNPASANLPAGYRASVGFAGLTTPNEQGVALTMVGGEYRIPHDVTASLSFAQASVTDIFRTTTDPQTQGGDIPYSTSILSLGAATARGPLAIGAAARLRTARFDAEHSHVGSFDVGATLDRLGPVPVRVALSTFLLSSSAKRESPTYNFAADAPLARLDSTFVLRGGYSFSQTDARGHDHYAFTTASYRVLEASAGFLQSVAYGNTSRRVRLGVGLRYAEYDVAFGREDGAAGISASYQVILTRVFR